MLNHVTTINTFLVIGLIGNHILILILIALELLSVILNPHHLMDDVVNVLIAP